MGDVAMTVPILNALVKQHPDLRITMLTKKAFTPLFEGIPNLEVFTAEVNGRHKGLKGLWKLHRELMELSISAVADLHNVLRSNILKRYFRLAKVPFVQINKGRREKRALTAAKNKAFIPLKSTVQRYCDVFDSLGLPIELATVRPLKQKALSEKTLSLIGQNNQKWIGIAAFAAFPGKTYPYNLMEEVIQKLDNTDKYKIFLFGGGDKEKAVLKKTADKSKHVVNMAGVVNLSQELELISHLDLMISMDSANAHLSAMYGIPTITLWGVTHPYAGFYPFGQDPDNALLADRSQYPLIPTSVYGKKVPKGYERAMETISPQQVLDKIDSVLS
ncbi:glycosyltransferase family 9 protein [Flavobacteriaceae bacterium D16]|nr:glycosyltransferase family 9 protein [Flavobacteriaceae bacterium D16]